MDSGGAGATPHEPHIPEQGWYQSPIKAVLAPADAGLLYDVDGESLSAPEAAYRVYQQRNELRRILAPILDAEGLAGCAEDCCQFCGRSLGLVPRHEPHCLVLDRDRLLGRTP